MGVVGLLPNGGLRAVVGIGGVVGWPMGRRLLRREGVGVVDLLADIDTLVRGEWTMALVFGAEGLWRVASRIGIKAGFSRPRRLSGLLLLKNAWEDKSVNERWVCEWVRWNTWCSVMGERHIERNVHWFGEGSTEMLSLLFLCFQHHRSCLNMAKRSLCQLPLPDLQILSLVEEVTVG